MPRKKTILEPLPNGEVRAIHVHALVVIQALHKEMSEFIRAHHMACELKGAPNAEDGYLYRDELKRLVADRRLRALTTAFSRSGSPDRSFGSAKTNRSIVLRRRAARA